MKNNNNNNKKNNAANQKPAWNTGIPKPEVRPSRSNLSLIDTRINELGLEPVKRTTQSQASRILGYDPVMLPSGGLAVKDTDSATECVTQQKN